MLGLSIHETTINETARIELFDEELRRFVEEEMLKVSLDMREADRFIQRKMAGSSREHIKLVGSAIKKAVKRYLDTDDDEKTNEYILKLMEEKSR